MSRASSYLSPVEVVFITDANYVLPTLVACNSIIENKSPEVSIRLNVIAVDIDEEASSYFLKLNALGVVVNVIQHRIEAEDREASHPYVSPAALLKFSLPKIFHNLDRVLYLDGDVIVRGDLSELFSIDISGKYAAVVKDMAAVIDEGHHRKHSHETYFNSGVMLLNLLEMRASNSCDILFDLKRSRKFQHFMDQDELNAVFGGNVVFMSPANNFMKGNLRHDIESIAKFYDVTLDEIFKTYQDPLIAHLTNSPKVWLSPSSSSFELWYSYLPEFAHFQYVKLINRYFEQQLGSLKEQLAAQEMDAARQRALVDERFSEIDVQIAQANERTVLADTKAEQATARAIHAEAEVVQVTERAVLAETEAAYAKEQAHVSGQQLQAILSSRSWRMTKPLRLMSKIARWFSRGARAWLTLKPGSRPRRVASNVLVHLKVWVLNSPRVRAQAIRVVQRFPRLKARLLAVGSQSTSALPTVGQIAPLVSDMPVAAARLYAKLLRARPEQNEQDGRFDAHRR